MRSKNMNLPFWLSKALMAAIVLIATLAPVMANDLPLAAGSPLTGVSFDDRPLLLPVQRNFQMAMLTSSTQIGRSCGRMEAYGWRTAQTEQRRVNLIFSNTVDRLRGLGYAVEAQTPSSISKDITLFTADRPDKHFLFMWSAGEIGLVMVLCESSPPLTGRMADIYNAAPAHVIVPPPEDVLQSTLETPSAPPKGRKVPDANAFLPVGDWTGDYTCMRGYTGATMHIDKFKGDDFQGTFRFYPTPKNPYIPKGSYEIYGQYDRGSKRILINPGKWLEHPNGTYKTIIIGSFDPAQRHFSGFFEGIMGCTSFEAKYDGKIVALPAQKTSQKHVKSLHKKVSAKKAPVIKTVTPDTVIAPAPSDLPPVTGGITLPGNTVTPASATAPTSALPLPPSAPPPESHLMTPAFTPTPVPAVTSSPVPLKPLSAVTAPLSPVAPAAASAAPLPAMPSLQPMPNASPSVVPLPLPAPAPTLQPTSSLAPRPGPHAIVLAGDWPATPGPPQLAAAPTFNPSVPQLPAAPTYNTNVAQVPQAPTYPVNSPQLSQAQAYDTNPPQLPQAQAYDTNPSQLPQAQAYDANVPQAEQASRYDDRVPALPDAPSYSIYKAPGT